MNCPKCGSETPPQQSFCNHCGALIEMGFDEVRDQIHGEALSESRQALVRKAGAWLATGIVLLAGAIAFRVTHFESDLPRFDETPVLRASDLEPARQPPIPDLPVLALPVPSAP